MTSHHDSGSTAPGAGDPEASGRASRRTFLTGAGAVVAAGGAVAAGVAGAGPAEAATRQEPAQTEGESQPIVAYISDAATGEITVMSGDREVTVTDRHLTQAFARKVR